MNGPATVSALLPRRTTIEGREVRLEPLDAASHTDALAAVLSGSANARLWEYLPDGPFGRPEEFAEAIHTKAASNDPLFFAVIQKRQRLAVGYASLMRMEPVHRVIEIGHILFASELQRTTAATEAIFLLASHVFDALGYRRLEWKCNDANESSRRAAVRFGFSYEGTFRQHMIIKGRNRDTAWYSMLDGEWPARKANFERWLDPANFDECGRQRSRLSS